MALEALKAYASVKTAETLRLVDQTIKNTAEIGDIRRENGESHVREPLYNKDVEKAIQDKITGIYIKQSRAIKKSEKLRSEINKMVTAGKNSDEILAKSLECIYLITGDEVFYKQNAENLKQV